MLRVLNILGTLYTGGIQETLMSYYRNIDRSKIQFDFLVTDVENHYYYEDEAISLGARVFRRPLRTKAPIGNMKGLVRVLKENPEIKIVHIHNSTPLMAIDALIACCLGVPVRMAHSRSAHTQINLLHRLFRPLLWSTTTHKIGVSTEAGVFLFGEKVMNTGKLILIHNARDLERFRFDVRKRDSLRREMGLENCFVLINIGRLVPVKNQGFLLEVFMATQKKIPNLTLLFVGDGELRDVLEQETAQRRLGDAVRFLGNRDDVPDLLQAADLFVLPSLHEGLPGVAVEAQAAGLPCLLSDTITRETDVTGNTEFLPIGGTSEKWVESILACKNFIRRDTFKEVCDAGYDIKKAANILENFYLNTLKEKSK